MVFKAKSVLGLKLFKIFINNCIQYILTRLSLLTVLTIAPLKGWMRSFWRQSMRMGKPMKRRKAREARLVADRCKAACLPGVWRGYLSAVPIAGDSEAET